MIQHVRDAAEAAGRDPMSIKFCVAAPMYIGDDWEHMRDQCRWFGGMVGNHVADIVAKYGSVRRRGAVPQALTDYIKGREGYDYNEHGRAGNVHTEFVPDEIVDRFCILGTADEHIEKLEAARRPRRRPVRRLPPARQQGGDAAGLRRDGDPGALRAHHGQGMTEVGVRDTAAVTDAAGAAPGARGRSPRRGGRGRRELTRWAWGLAGILAVALIWEVYKLLGPADGVVIGDRPRAAAHHRPRHAARVGHGRPARRAGHALAVGAAALGWSCCSRRSRRSASRPSAGSSASSWASASRS